jgi:hypothetical protein
MIANPLERGASPLSDTIMLEQEAGARPQAAWCHD